MHEDTGPMDMQVNSFRGSQCKGPEVGWSLVISGLRRPARLEQRWSGKGRTGGREAAARAVWTLGAPTGQHPQPHPHSTDIPVTPRLMQELSQEPSTTAQCARSPELAIGRPSTRRSQHGHRNVLAIAVTTRQEQHGGQTSSLAPGISGTPLGRDAAGEGLDLPAVSPGSRPEHPQVRQVTSPASFLSHEPEAAQPSDGPSAALQLCDLWPLSGPLCQMS